MHTYRVQLTRYMSYKVKARSAAGARKQVWDDIKSAYTYGYTSLSDMRRAKVTRLD